MGKKIGIIADTTADLPIGLAEHKGIELNPIHISINGESRLHGIDIINQEVLEHLKQKDEVVTAPPTPQEYYQIFKKASEDYDQVYSMHVSRELSKCYDNAVLGLEMFIQKQKAEEKGIIVRNNISVIDTMGASISQGQIVNRLANIVKTQHDLSKIDKYIQWLIKKTMMFFVVDNLYWLKKSGALNMFSGLFGKLLDIKPVVQLENGILTPVDNPKGKSTAIENMFRIIRATTPEYRRGIEIWVGHSASILDAKYVRRQLSKIFKIQEKKIPLVEAGPTIVSHTGPGVVCVSIIPK